VNLYADTAIMLLLPELEKGLFDDNWRIRYRYLFIVRSKNYFKANATSLSQEKLIFPWSY
jgi:hypothetical protein